jgi:hypothetical protein
MKVYPKRSIEDATTQSVRIFAIAQRVTGKIPDCFVTPPQRTFQVRNRRQVLHSWIFPGNASW